jgi:hypothetical protein
LGHAAFIPSSGEPSTGCPRLSFGRHRNGLCRESDSLGLAGLWVQDSNDHPGASAGLVDVLNDAVQRIQAPWDSDLVSYLQAL